MTQNLEHFTERDYPVQLTQFDDEGVNRWLAEYIDLPGCMADGSDPTEAVQILESVKRDWMEAAIESGMDIPEPSGSTEFSGKLLLRLPRFLHAGLAIRSKMENTSLNQLIVSLLSQHRTVQSGLAKLNDLNKTEARLDQHLNIITNAMTKLRSELQLRNLAADGPIANSQYPWLNEIDANGESSYPSGELVSGANTSIPANRRDPSFVGILSSFSVIKYDIGSGIESYELAKE